MPEQSLFFDERTDTKRVRVVKTYDTSYARECFDAMNDEALRFLSKSLDLGSMYEDSPIEVTWEDLEDQAREDGHQLSFFVVIEESGEKRGPVYVSPDLPSANAVANSILR